jgi:hypothetical protein
VSTATGTQQALAGDWRISTGRRANISQLAKATHLDRATIVRRLAAAGVAPVRTRAKEKQFDVNQATAVLGAAREVDANQNGYHKARTQKTTAEAARILLKLQRERGELAPVAELREGAFQLVKALHQRFSRYARDARGRLFKAKSLNEIERILASDFASIFEDLKRDYPAI